MSTNQEFTLAELAACAEREAGYRRSCYPKWDKVVSLAELSPKRARELAMMEALAALLRQADDAFTTLDPPEGSPVRVFPPACPKCCQRRSECVC